MRNTQYPLPLVVIQDSKLTYIRYIIEFITQTASERLIYSTEIGKRALINTGSNSRAPHHMQPAVGSYLKKARVFPPAGTRLAVYY
jgi:hypothetical protein